MLIWYLARAAGIAGFAALSVATGAGAYASRRSAHLDRRVVWQYLHRGAALSGVTLIVLHISTLLLDPYAHVGVLGALVPFLSGYRPWQVTLGVISMYLLVLLAVTGVLRSRFAATPNGVRWWRAIHLSSYAAWAMSAWHFLVTGTDSSHGWAQAVLYGGVAVVAAGVIARVVDGPAVGTRDQVPALRTADRPAARPAALGTSR